MRVCMVVVSLLIGGMSWGNTLPQQQLAMEQAMRASNRLVIPPQLMLYLSGKGADKRILQALRREQEERLLARLSFDKEGLFPRQLRELLRQALQQAHSKQLANFNDMLLKNVWEMQSVFSFTHEVGSDVQFFLDLQYGTHTIVSSTRYGGISGFSIVDPQRKRVLDFGMITAVDIEQDFLALQSLPKPVFSPRHYIFHGEQYVYILNRETLALEYVGHSDTYIDERTSLANLVHEIDLVNDSLLAVRYSTAGGNREFVQLIDLNELSTAAAKEIDGTLLAVAPRGNLLAVQKHRQLEVIDLDSGDKHVFLAHAATSVQFSADGKRLAYMDGNTLHLVHLAASTPQIPQRIALAPEQTLASVELPASELLWDGDDLYVMHRTTLFRITDRGEIAWQQELPADLHAMQAVDAEHLALFSEQGMLVYNKEDGTRRLQLAVDSKQRIADQTFADRYLSLLLENRLHFSTFDLTLARIPLTQLLHLLKASPLLQKIAATEEFTLQRGRVSFTELLLSAVEQHLTDNTVPIDQLVGLLRELYQDYHLVTGSFYVAANISRVLMQHADEVAHLTADDPTFQQLLLTSFF